MRKHRYLIVIFFILFVAFGCDKTMVKPISVDSNGFLLDGEFLIPKTKEKCPVVIIVSGSGPSDMDGSTFQQTPYKDIAYGLAKQGIATIRCNKVANQYSDDVASNYDFTIQDEYFYTIKSMIAMARARKEIDADKIFLLGHSFGSQIIPYFLVEDEELAGGIIMAGTTMHILDLILEQYLAISEDLYLEYKLHCEYFRDLTKVKNKKNYCFGGYEAYYVSYNQLDLELVKELDCPLLLMQGALDLQVSPSHFQVYRDLLKDKDNAYFLEYETLNHLFTDGVNETIYTAYRENRRVDQQVIDDIVDFIKSQ